MTTSTRNTLAINGLDAGNTVSRSTNADTYERRGRSVTVTFDADGEITGNVDSSDGQWFAPTTEGVMLAIGAAQ